MISFLISSVMFSIPELLLLLSVTLTVDSHLAVAVLLQEKLDVRAGLRDVLRPGPDPRAQPISLVEQERKTAHGRPAHGRGGGERTVTAARSRSRATPDTTALLWSVFCSMTCLPPPPSHCGGHFLSLSLATDVKGDDDSAEKSETSVR